MTSIRITHCNEKSSSKKAELIRSIHSHASDLEAGFWAVQGTMRGVHRAVASDDLPHRAIEVDAGDVHLDLPSQAVRTGFRTKASEFVCHVRESAQGCPLCSNQTLKFQEGLFRKTARLLYVRRRLSE